MQKSPLLFLAIIFLPWIATAQSGHDSYFPEGFTQPKIAVGGNGAAVAGPTPFFKQRQATNGTNAKMAPTPQQEKLSKQNGNTDLMNAAASGDLQLVKQLIDLGADVNAANKFGSTALMGAAAGGYLPIVQELIEHQANVNAQGKDRSTSLMFAARNGHVAIVEYLMNQGADLKQKNKNGKTALNLANDAGLKEIVELLKEAEKQQKKENEENAS
jgi:ankyrin repeat protein